MTVCAAAICRFVYGTLPNGDPDIGYVIITASDRRLTDTGLGIEYEPNQGKYSKIANRIVVLGVNNMTAHSAILIEIQKLIKDNQDIDVIDAARLYSKILIEKTAEESERLYLAPFRMTHEEFRAAQVGMKESIVRDISDNILQYSLHTEAIISGIDKDGRANIYTIDARGTIRCHNDIGFAALGSGGDLAASYFMSRGYWNGVNYYEGLISVYSAKKYSESAPGVGKQTDMSFINRDSAYTVYIGVHKALEDLYPIYQKRHEKLNKRFYDQVIESEKSYAATHAQVESAMAAQPEDTGGQPRPDESADDG